MFVCVSQEARAGIGYSLKLGIIGSCELSEQVAGIWIQVLWNSKCS